MISDWKEDFRLGWEDNIKTNLKQDESVDWTQLAQQSPVAALVNMAIKVRVP
jgi:hypothetical protein